MEVITRSRFNRLHGDSFIWTDQLQPVRKGRPNRFNRLHGDSFIWTQAIRILQLDVHRRFNRLHGDSFIWTRLTIYLARRLASPFQSPSWRFFYLDGRRPAGTSRILWFQSPSWRFFYLDEIVRAPFDAQTGFQSPSWRFFYLDVRFSGPTSMSRRNRVSIAFMAILLFGPARDKILGDMYDLVSIAFMAILLFGPNWLFNRGNATQSFNRLHGDSFIWTEQPHRVG